MFPQSGYGFIWDEVNIRDGRAETTIFVPDTKMIHYVSISIKDIDKTFLLPTTWIRWEGVGMRDATKPFPLLQSSLMDGGREFIQPTFTNQTVFKTILLFPDRKDLVDFVGKYNAWSPHVGIVQCDEDAEIVRGAYGVSYIERDYDSNKSAFKLIKSNLKFPEGFLSEKDKRDYEGLEREIELAIEESRVLADKGRTRENEMQFIPKQQRVETTDEFDDYTDNNSVVKTDIIVPNWSKNKTKEQIIQIEMKKSFVKNVRYHEIILYKKKERGVGLVGWTPRIGSVLINNLFHKSSDKKAEVGNVIITRVEFIPKSDQFEVNTIVEFLERPSMPFNIDTSNGRAQLIIQCSDLDLKNYSPLPNLFNERKVGVIEHPTLYKVLAYEDIALDKKWKNQKVTALLIHYEDIEEDTNEHNRIRLILSSVQCITNDEFAEEDRNEKTNVFIQNGIPDQDDSDSDEEEEENEDEDEGRGNSEEEEGEGEKYRKKSNEKEPRSAFKPFESGSKYNTKSSSNKREETFGVDWNGDFGGGGFGEYEETNGGGSQKGRNGYNSKRFNNYDNGRGVNGGCNRNGGAENSGWNCGNDRRGGDRRDGRESGSGGGSNNHRDSRNDDYNNSLPMEEHGFEQTEQYPKKTLMRQGILVSVSKKSSIFYTLTNKLVEFHDDAGDYGLKLGDSAEFEVIPSTSIFAYEVVQQKVIRINDLFPCERIVDENNELCIRVPGCLNPVKDRFECKYISKAKLASPQTSIKLHKLDTNQPRNFTFIDKSRMKIGHYYDINIKFDTDQSKWIFMSIDNTTRSFQVEEEDEIDKFKRELREKKEPRRAISRNEDDDWIRVEKGNDHSTSSRQNEELNLNDYSRTGNNHSNKNGISNTRFSVPSQHSSNRSSIVSESTHLSSSALKNDKAIKNELDTVKRMLKTLWGYEEVQQIAEVKNSYLYETIDNWMINEAEDSLENDSRNSYRK